MSTYSDLKMFGLHSCDGCGAVVKDWRKPLHDQWHEAHPAHETDLIVGTPAKDEK